MTCEFFKRLSVAASVIVIISVLYIIAARSYYDFNKDNSINCSNQENISNEYWSLVRDYCVMSKNILYLNNSNILRYDIIALSDKKIVCGGDNYYITFSEDITIYDSCKGKNIMCSVNQKDTYKLCISEYTIKECCDVS